MVACENRAISDHRGFGSSKCRRRLHQQLATGSCIVDSKATSSANGSADIVDERGYIIRRRVSGTNDLVSMGRNATLRQRMHVLRGVAAETDITMPQEHSTTGIARLLRCQCSEGFSNPQLAVQWCL
jgi:hypothetical protein